VGVADVVGLDLISAAGTFNDLPATWPTLGAGGLVSLIVILLITGRGLATRREVDEANRRADEANQRADRWEAVALEALRQNGRLLIGAEVAAEVIKALPIGPRRADPTTHDPPPADQPGPDAPKGAP
jgi:hypothetical protein